MDLAALKTNIAVAARSAPSLRDAIAKIAWLYNDSLPKLLRKERRTISFDLPLPIGHIELVVRSNAGADSFIFSEVFGHEYYDLALESPPRTILDLGANVGMTAVYFARKYPGAKIACVEPIPTNLELLRQNLASNKVEASVFAAAIDSSDGETTMDVGQLDYGFKVASEGLTVPTISVQTILSELGWANIDLLKIDIEGHEGVVLKQNCDWLNKVQAVCIEIHDDYTETDLIELAENYGFSSPRLLPGNWLLLRPG